jgi:hypothetical protein
LPDPWIDYLHALRRRRLLYLDADVVIIGLYPEKDESGTVLQPCMSHGVAHQFGDGDPRAVGSTVEHRRRDGIVQGSSG